jgi:hypothetical protein
VLQIIHYTNVQTLLSGSWVWAHPAWRVEQFKSKWQLNREKSNISFNSLIAKVKILKPGDDLSIFKEEVLKNLPKNQIDRQGPKKF